MNQSTSRAATLVEDGNRQALLLLRTVFTAAPILFGLDKFLHVLTDDWERYLAGWIESLSPWSAHTIMLIVGVIEIIAGLLVALLPRFGGYLVSVWLLGIIISLLSVGGYADVALRDFGLLVGALALSRLATTQHSSKAAHFSGTNA